MHAKFGSDILKAKKVIHQIDENVNVNNKKNKNKNKNQIADTRVSERPSPSKTLPDVLHIDSVSHAIRATDLNDKTTLMGNISASKIEG